MSTRYQASRRELAAVRATVREALDAMQDVGKVLLELINTREKDCCAICGRRSKRVICARADCQTEKERIYQADRRERRYALKGKR